MNESILRGVAMVSHSVKKLSEKYPDSQIGKTIVQKIMYMLTRERAIDFNYSMYHYGPYSAQVSSEINFAENIGAVEIDWISDKGYFIKPKSDELEGVLSEGDKQAIDRVIDKYGGFNAIEISIIATALFVEDNFEVTDTEELVRVVTSLKPQYSNRIKNILKEGGVISETT
jgi:uncharacterized protein YwgA